MYKIILFYSYPSPNHFFLWGKFITRFTTSLERVHCIEFPEVSHQTTCSTVLPLAAAELLSTYLIGPLWGAVSFRFIEEDRLMPSANVHLYTIKYVTYLIRKQ